MQSKDTQADPMQEFEASGLGSVELFAALSKEKSIATLMRGIEYHACAPGSTLVVQGNYTNRLWIVLSGLVDRYRTDPGEPRAKHLGTLKPGDWFGEGCALSNQPALFSIEAKVNCNLVSVDGAIFKTLYRTEKAFQKLVDERYRETSLAAHLRLIPLFQGLSEKELRPLRKRVEFQRIPKEGKVIAADGEDADAIYLVRSGAVRSFVKQDDGRERIIGYYMDNSVFGERSLSSGDPKWLGTFETLSPTDLVKIPASLVEELLPAEVAIDLTTTADSLAKQDVGATPGFFDLLQQSRKKELGAEELEIMVSNESAKGGNALVIDLTKCVRCNACVESCVAVHADRVPRLSKTGSRVSKQVTLASACYHCDVPECMMSCNYGAIRRDLKGTIDFVWDNCVGCTSCVDNCPYNVIRMTKPQAESKPIEYPSALAKLPVIGHLFRPAARKDEPSAAAVAGSAHAVTGKDEQVSGKAVKCDLCAGMPFEACVYNCPCSAIERVAPEALFEN